MTDAQMFFSIASIVLILVLALLAQFKWLPGGKPKFVILFLGGFVAMALLLIAEVPPSWFSASTEGFGLALSFTVGGLLPSTNQEEVTFRRPFFLGIGLTLLVANLVQAVQNGL